MYNFEEIMTPPLYCDILERTRLPFIREKFPLSVIVLCRTMTQSTCLMLLVNSLLLLT